MSPSPSEDENSFHVERSFLERVKRRYPWLVEVVSQFRQNPMSGDTLRRLLGKEPGSYTNPDAVMSLSPPKLWQDNAPIVISHYADYASDRLPAYWNSTIPDLREQYGSVIRYEHHDAVPLRQSTERYDIATVGRALQDQAGNDAFWMWFNTLMVDGVETVDGAVDVIHDIGIDDDIDFSYLEQAVNESLYHEVIASDVDMLFRGVDVNVVDELQAQYDNGEPVFVLFVNGRVVQPSYNSIVGVVEEILASRTRTEPVNTHVTEEEKEEQTSEGSVDETTEEWTATIEE